MKISLVTFNQGFQLGPACEIVSYVRNGDAANAYKWDISFFEGNTETLLLVGTRIDNQKKHYQLVPAAMTQSIHLTEDPRLNKDPEHMKKELASLKPAAK